MEEFCLDLATMLLKYSFLITSKKSGCLLFYLFIYLPCVEELKTSLQFPCERIKDATFKNFQVRKIMNEYSPNQ